MFRPVFFFTFVFAAGTRGTRSCHQRRNNDSSPPQTFPFSPSTVCELLPCICWGGGGGWGRGRGGWNSCSQQRPQEVWPCLAWPALHPAMTTEDGTGGGGLTVLFPTPSSSLLLLLLLSTATSCLWARPRLTDVRGGGRGEGEGLTETLCSSEPRPLFCVEVKNGLSPS